MRENSQEETRTHRTEIALIFEMVQIKYDRFGWDRLDDRFKTMMLEDFYDAVSTYYPDEIREAVRIYGRQNTSRKTPNEGDLIPHLNSIRKEKTAADPPKPEPSPELAPSMTPERVAEIIAEVDAKRASKVADET